MPKVFRLFSNVIATKGYTQSMIHDLQRETNILVPNEFIEMLNECEDKTLDEICAQFEAEDHQTVRSWYKQVEDAEYGFWTSEPERFPPLNTEYIRAFDITNAIVDSDVDSNHNFADIFRQLEGLGCLVVQLRFYHQPTIEYLDKVLGHLQTSRIKGVELILGSSPEMSFKGLNELAIRHQRIALIGVFNCSEYKAEYTTLGVPIVFETALVRDCTACGVISKNHFRFNRFMYIETQNFNNCLNGKIAIDVVGAIKNCPSMNESFGQIAETSLEAALGHDRFRNKWLIRKDQIDDCKVCEFRNVCTDCRAYTKDESNPYSKPAKCSYDPYSGTNDATS